MTQATAEPSQAFVEKYYQGYGLMLELQQLPIDEIPLAEVKRAAEYLAEAIEIEAHHVQPYVLLASIFLSIDQRGLADKYMDMAASIDPSFPQYLALKEHMMTPPSLLRKPRPSGGTAPSPIQRLGRLRQPDAPPGISAKGKDLDFDIISFPE